jgi:hypothetical protein
MEQRLTENTANKAARSTGASYWDLTPLSFLRCRIKLHKVGIPTSSGWSPLYLHYQISLWRNSSGKCKMAGVLFSLFSAFLLPEELEPEETLWGASVRAFPPARHEIQIERVRLNVSTAVTMKNSVFWDIKPQFVPHRKHITSPLQSPGG